MPKRPTPQREPFMVEKVYVPFPRQKAFHDATQRYRLFGGQAGPGKTTALRWDVLAQVMSIPRWHGLILRRTMPELLQSQIHPFRTDVPAELYRWDGQRNIATFVNGSMLRFGHCEHDDDVTIYQSDEYGTIAFDELTHFSMFVWLYLSSRNRSTAGGRPNMSGATNPGGKGHVWVKALWIDKQPAPGMQRSQYNPDDYAFIPASLEDNPVMMKKDPDYRKRLEILPEAERRALLEGRWDIMAGAYFDCFDLDRNTISAAEFEADFEERPWSYLWLSGDWGFTDDCVIHWHALDERGEPITYRELVLKHQSPEKIADAIVAHTPEKEVRMLRGFRFSPDAWSKRESIRTVADQLNAKLRGWNFPPATKADNDRIGGWQLMYSHLQRLSWRIVRGNEKYNLGCPELISALPRLLRDEPPRQEDIAEAPFDHAPDSARYGLKHIGGKVNVPREVLMQRDLKPHLDRGDFQSYWFARQDREAEDRRAAVEATVGAYGRRW